MAKAKPEIKEEAKPEIKEEAKPEIKEEVAKTRVRRIPDKPKRTYVSAGTYTLSLPADQDEFLIPTADLVQGCSCLLALGNLEIISEDGDKLDGN